MMSHLKRLAIKLKAAIYGESSNKVMLLLLKSKHKSKVLHLFYMHRVREKDLQFSVKYLQQI